MLGALDLLRRLGWTIVDFIYNLIDNLFKILQEINLYDIVNSVSKNSIFANFHSGIIAIAITLLALFTIWKFIMKMIEPEDKISTYQIFLETIKCTLLVLMSVFLFSQANTFSIKLSGYTSSIFSTNDITLSDSMLNMYVKYADGYENSDEFENEDILKNLKDDTFTKKRMYNDKYISSDNWILPNEKDYKYEINWIMSILIGGFFLYALFFSGMMLARRQIEFIFLFVISPVVFATSIGNKQRRMAVIEQLVSLLLQGAVVMLIIGITAIVMQSINNTTFFQDSVFQDMVLKSLMFIGCGTFLLTGSQVINRFIGANVSANSGREQFMSLLGFGQVMNTVASASGSAGIGAGLTGLGFTSSVIGKVGGNRAINKVGNAIANFGNRITERAGNPNSLLARVGGFISQTGSRISYNTPSVIGNKLRHRGMNNIRGSINNIMPRRPMYRNRYRER